MRSDGYYWVRLKAAILRGPDNDGWEIAFFVGRAWLFPGDGVPLNASRMTEDYEIGDQIKRQRFRMKADVTLAGDTIHVVIENPDRKFDGQFALTLESPVDVAQLVAQLRDLADQIASYASQFPPAAA